MVVARQPGVAEVGGGWAVSGGSGQVVSYEVSLRAEGSAWGPDV